ncbi:MAG TPA: hypothetical protein VFQ91_25370 [Bryobacteraceae bacterium]|nr:hypothetical protein [Bryobacteraceae bacterium]
MKNYGLTLATVACLLFAYPSRAEAYLDPVTGSVAFQVAIASTLTGLAALKVYWRRVRSLFRKEAEGTE